MRTLTRTSPERQVFAGVDTPRTPIMAQLLMVSDGRW